MTRSPIGDVNYKGRVINESSQMNKKYRVYFRLRKVFPKEPVYCDTHNKKKKTVNVVKEIQV